MSSKLILCADGGATSTKLALIEKSSGKVIKKYTGGPLYFTGDKKQGLLNLHKIIQQISDKNAIEHSIVGVSGIDTENELAEAKKIFTAFFNKFIANSKVIVVNDIQLVLHNTKSKTKNKIAIIAGTGSNCVGTDGKVLKKAGGLGYLLTDQGSGYHIGYTALKKYVKSKDKRGEKSKILEEEIESFFSVKSHIELKDIIYSETFLKKDIAAITPLVVKCANDNDKLCSKILDTAGKNLATHVKGVSKQLNIKSNVTIITAGSIFKIPQVREGFEKRVVKYVNDLKVEYPKKPSFYGGYLLLKNNNFKVKED